MGWCHEFGPDISETCNHPMTAGEDHCFCSVCGVTCQGRFAGCVGVWARGPKEVTVVRPHERPTERVSRVDAITSPGDAMALDDQFVGRDPFAPEPSLADRGDEPVHNEPFADPFVAVAHETRPAPIEPPVGVRVWSPDDEERLIGDVVDRVSDRVVDTVRAML